MTTKPYHPRDPKARKPSSNTVLKQIDARQKKARKKP